MAVTSVASGTSSVKALDPNASRKGLVFQNTDANACYVLLGSGTASSTNFSFSLAQDANASITGFHGEVNVIWAADGSGALKVTSY
jgi:UDP-3-O-acyl-N-acetylglucosamine deacetylase